MTEVNPTGSNRRHSTPENIAWVRPKSSPRSSRRLRSMTSLEAARYRLRRDVNEYQLAGVQSDGLPQVRLNHKTSVGDPLREESRGFGRSILIDLRPKPSESFSHDPDATLEVNSRLRNFAADSELRRNLDCTMTDELMTDCMEHFPELAIVSGLRDETPTKVSPDDGNVRLPGDGRPVDGKTCPLVANTGDVDSTHGKRLEMEKRGWSDDDEAGVGVDEELEMMRMTLVPAARARALQSAGCRPRPLIGRRARALLQFGATVEQY